MTRSMFRQQMPPMGLRPPEPPPEHGETLLEPLERDSAPTPSRSAPDHRRPIRWTPAAPGFLWGRTSLVAAVSIPAAAPTRHPGGSRRAAGFRAARRGCLSIVSYIVGQLRFIFGRVFGGDHGRLTGPATVATPQLAAGAPGTAQPPTGANRLLHLRPATTCPERCRDRVDTMIGTMLALPRSWV